MNAGWGEGEKMETFTLRNREMGSYRRQNLKISMQGPREVTALSVSVVKRAIKPATSFSVKHHQKL